VTIVAPLWMSTRDGNTYCRTVTAPHLRCNHCDDLDCWSTLLSSWSRNMVTKPVIIASDVRTGSVLLMGDAVR
jgi:hypothetical protein